MGIPIPQNGNGRLVIEYLMSNGDTANNVLAFDYTNLPIGVDSDYLRVLCEEWWVDKQGAILNLMTPETVVTGITSYWFDQVATEFIGIGTALRNDAGTGVGGQLPNGVAALGSAITSFPKVRGKVYFPALKDNLLTVGGQFTVPAVAAILAAVVAYYQDYTDAASAVLSPRIWSPSQLAFFEIAETGTSVVPAYQRRRRQGVGI